MNLLLDTHTFIWFVGGSPELKKTARGRIENPKNQCFVSIASLWEMSIKVGLGKLDLKGPFDEVINDIAENGFELLPVFFKHLSLNAQLEWHHRDPFDRLLIAQSLTENMPIISRDELLDPYFVGVEGLRVW